jgi:insertion element IS1 protein InsB
MALNPAYGHGQAAPQLVLKADEMWSFVASKANQRWLWWVEDGHNGRVVAFVFGRRTHQTFRRLLSLLAQANIEVTQWLTDSWWAYFDCLDQTQRVEDKALMQSLERKHLTLRTRIKRLTRRTICFSRTS